jgi:alkylation response protein AidB-like acyl-CoA dehydrogenase
MDFRLSTEDEAFRAELRQFLQDEMPADWLGASRNPDNEDWGFTLQLRKKLAQKGWLTMHWPHEYGGQGAPQIKSTLFADEVSYASAPGRDIFGVRMLAPTLMIHGTEDQKKEYLPPIARGKVQWCQGYSEPGSGSDLASLQTSAVSDGDDYIINGSKIWTSMAHRADWIFMLARTDPGAPKHRGISFVLVNMNTPGVTVRPILNMTGGHEFNQVFFDDVRVPKSNRVGEENRGWYVAVTLLDFERSGVDYSACARRLVDDTADYASKTGTNGGAPAGGSWVRNALTDCYIEAEACRLLAYRVAWMQEQGMMPNMEASMSKVMGSETLNRTASTCLEVLDLYGVLKPGDSRAPMKGRVPEQWMNSFSGTIAAGTSEVQRNIIATRGLGLPRG